MTLELAPHQETAERKLEATVKELQQLTEEVKVLRDSVQQGAEENSSLRATIMDKDLCLEQALADADSFKAQLAEKEEQVSEVLVYRSTQDRGGCKGGAGRWGLGLQVHTGQGRVVKVEQVGEVWVYRSTQVLDTLTN